MSNRRARLGWGTIGAGLLGVAAYISQMIIGLNMPVWLFVGITAIGTVATASSLVLARRGVLTARKAAETAAAKQRKAMQDVLVPLVAHLGQIVSSGGGNDRKILQQQMKQAILALTTVVMGVEESRTCLLEQVSNCPPGNRELKCLNTLWHGRGDTPTAVFKESEVRGKELFDLMDAGKSIFVADVAELPTSQQPTNNTYRTCIAATVLAGDDRFGMLTIDSPKVGALSKEDVRLVEVLARLLGAALAVKP